MEAGGDGPDFLGSTVQSWFCGLYSSGLVCFVLWLAATTGNHLTVLFIQLNYRHGYHHVNSEQGSICSYTLNFTVKHFHKLEILVAKNVVVLHRRSTDYLTIKNCDGIHCLWTCVLDQRI